MSKNTSGMSLIVKTIARISTAFILLFGVYIIAYGHLTPGGGFPGGVILGSGFILLCLAFGKETCRKKLTSSQLSILDSFGAMMFLGIALLGYLGGTFFLNIFLDKGGPFTLFSAGTIPFANIAIGIKVGSCLFAVFIALAAFRVASKKER